MLGIPTPPSAGFFNVVYGNLRLKRCRKMRFKVDVRDFPAGSVGSLDDAIPLINSSVVRPYVIATLLHRGAVKRNEIIATISQHCPQCDLKVGGWDSADEEYCDGTRLEKIVDQVLGVMVAEKFLRYNEEQELWVLTSDNLGHIISWVTALGTAMPPHLLADLDREQMLKLPLDYKLSATRENEEG